MRLEKTEREDKALKDAITLWGVTAQVGMVMEECGELLTALNRFDRGRASAKDVAEEIADVQILMGQMAKVFGEELVDNFMDEKVNRLIVRIEKSQSLKEG